jgi:hypothetical protein
MASLLSTAREPFSALMLAGIHRKYHIDFLWEFPLNDAQLLLSTRLGTYQTIAAFRKFGKSE